MTQVFQANNNIVGEKKTTFVGDYSVQREGERERKEEEKKQLFDSSIAKYNSIYLCLFRETDADLARKKKFECHYTREVYCSFLFKSLPIFTCSIENSY